MRPFVVGVLILALVGGLVGVGWAQAVWVRPHVRSNGSYVEGHYRTAPDSNPYNNWSTQGNVNPFTGKQGTADPYRQYQGYSNPYSNPHSTCVPTIYQPCR